MSASMAAMAYAKFSEGATGAPAWDDLSFSERCRWSEIAGVVSDAEDRIAEQVRVHVQDIPACPPGHRRVVALSGEFLGDDGMALEMVARQARLALGGWEPGGRATLIVVNGKATMHLGLRRIWWHRLLFWRR